MESSLKSLFTDGSRYQKAYQLYLERSIDVQQEFIDNQLPDIMDGTLKGKSHLTVISVGSGSGELDLKILSMLHQKNKNMTVDIEVVDPVKQPLDEYKDLVSESPGLDYVTFTWNEMTADGFAEKWKREGKKKVDFIHMLQMMYYVEDAEATISFYQSLLNQNGKLLISLMTGESGWAKLDKTYGKDFYGKISVFMDDIKMCLDSKGCSYKSYLLQSVLDITDCFTEGNEEGELMLDLLSDVLHFSQSASPELKSGVMAKLLQDCSGKSNGKVMFDNNCEMIIIDQLS